MSEKAGQNGIPAEVEKALNSSGAGGIAVVPLTTCPHIDQVEKVPDQGIDVAVPCSVCEDKSENWICLKCYAVNCARFVNGHGMKHFEDNGHALALSFSDVTVWCYQCEHYIHNEVFSPAKEAVLKSKFPAADEPKSQ